MIKYFKLNIISGVGHTSVKKTTLQAKLLWTDGRPLDRNSTQPSNNCCKSPNVLMLDKQTCGARQSGFDPQTGQRASLCLCRSPLGAPVFLSTQNMFQDFCQSFMHKQTVQAGTFVPKEKAEHNEQRQAHIPVHNLFSQKNNETFSWFCFRSPQLIFADVFSINTLASRLFNQFKPHSH